MVHIHITRGKTAAEIPAGLAQLIGAFTGLGSPAAGPNVFEDLGNLFDSLGAPSPALDAAFAAAFAGSPADGPAIEAEFAKIFGNSDAPSPLVQALDKESAALDALAPSVFAQLFNGGDFAGVSIKMLHILSVSYSVGCYFTAGTISLLHIHVVWKEEDLVLFVPCGQPTTFRNIHQ